MFTSISIYVVCKTKITRTFLNNLIGEDYVIKYLGVCTSSKALIIIVLPASGIMTAGAISKIASNHLMDEKVEQLKKDHQDICGNPPPFQGIVGVKYKKNLEKTEIVDNPLPTYPSRHLLLLFFSHPISFILLYQFTFFTSTFNIVSTLYFTKDLSLFQRVYAVLSSCLFLFSVQMAILFAYYLNSL